MSVELAELSERDREQITALATAAFDHDGVAPLSEEHLLALARQGATAWLVRRGEELCAVGSRSGSAVEVAVHPAARRQGMGSDLVRAALASDASLAFWAHGDLPAAQATARSTGLQPARELLRMTRSGGEVPGEVGLAVVTYAEAQARGRGEEFLSDWLTLNARAFADHPEQGRWQRADLDDRIAEPWFDPHLLWVAAKDGTPLGSVWVKHEESDEIYVLAVNPDQAGRGIGTRLLQVALRAIAARGGRVVDLYVDGDNTAAVRLYEKAGFVISSRDVQYAAVATASVFSATIGP